MRVRKYRSMLYVPGNTPAMVQQATVYGADAVLLDLEDAIAPDEKDAARDLLCRHLPLLERGDCVITVRINGLDSPLGERDIRAVVPLGLDALRIPKVESAEAMRDVDALITQLEAEHGLQQRVEIHAMIETAKGVLNAAEIATSTPRITALTFGAQDLLADMGLRRTDTAGLAFPQGQVLLAAKAARLHVLDTPFIDVDDEEGLRASAEHAKSLGYIGKAVINPRQIDIVNAIFSPSQAEIDHAMRVVGSFNAHKAAGNGVFALDGKMVDRPVVEQAINVLRLADIDPAAL